MRNGKSLENNHVIHSNRVHMLLQCLLFKGLSFCLQIQSYIHSLARGSYLFRSLVRSFALKMLSNKFLLANFIMKLTHCNNNGCLFMSALFSNFVSVLNSIYWIPNSHWSSHFDEPHKLNGKLYNDCNKTGPSMRSFNKRC